MRSSTLPALRQLRRAPSCLLVSESSSCRSLQQPTISSRCASSASTARTVNSTYRKSTTPAASRKPPAYSNRVTSPGNGPERTFNAMSVDDVDTTLAPLPTIPTPAAKTAAPISSPAPTDGASEFVQAVQSTSPSFGGSSNGNSDASIDWSSSFHGLSTTAFEPHVAAVLMAPLNTDDVEIKPDGIAYLPEIKYRRILNQAFGPGGWGLAPRGELVVGERVVTREYALVVHGR